MDKQFKVRERFYAEATGTEDKDYDRVTFFDNQNAADGYYFTVSGGNYYTDMWEHDGFKWVSRGSICHSQLAR